MGRRRVMVGIVHPLLGGGCRGQDVLAVGRTGPPERQSNGQACRLEPAVRDGPHSIDIPACGDLVGLQQEDPESRFAQAGDSIHSASVRQEQARRLGHHPLGNPATQPIRQGLEAWDLGHDDGGRTAEPRDARRLLADGSRPRGGIRDGSADGRRAVGRPWPNGRRVGSRAVNRLGRPCDRSPGWRRRTSTVAVDVDATHERLDGGGDAGGFGILGGARTRSLAHPGPIERGSRRSSPPTGSDRDHAHEEHSDHRERGDDRQEGLIRRHRVRALDPSRQPRARNA